MVALPWDEEWFRRCGRLEEADEGAERLLTGRLGRMSRAQYATPPYRSSRPMGPAGGTSFYLSHTILRRTRRGPAATVPADVAAPAGRSYIFPDKAMSRVEASDRQRRLSRQGGGRSFPAGMVGQLKAMGGVYDRGRRCWHVPRDMVAKRVVPPAWRGRDAASAWLSRRLGGPDGSPGTAARFQAYVERAAESENGRRAEIESDTLGEVSFGTIGRSSVERIGFWEEAEARERPGGRLQHRIIAELPHWLSADDRRRIAVGFCQAFEKLCLPFHAVVHLPDVDEGGDERNVHLHVLYSDRPIEPVPSAPAPDREGRAVLEFARRKRPEVAHVGWPGSLRRHFARVVNQAIADGVQAGKPPPEGRGFYDPRPYREMGVEKMPAQHMGAWRMRLERAGVPTLRGVRNGWKEGAWRVIEAASCEAEAARHLGRLASRVVDTASAHPSSKLVAGLADGAADLLVVAPAGERTREVLDEVRRDFVAGRALRRAAWASAEAARGAGAPSPAGSGNRLGAPARRPGRAGAATVRRKGVRLSEIEAEALAAAAGVVLPATAAPGPPHRAGGQRPEAEPRVEAVLRALLLAPPRDESGAASPAAARSVDAVERGGLIERLKACRAAAAAAHRRTAAATAPKMPIKRSDHLTEGDRGKLRAWRERRVLMDRAVAEAEETVLAALVRLGRTLADAEDRLGRAGGPGEGPSSAWEAIAGELAKSPWPSDGTVRPVLTWLDELRQKPAPSGRMPDRALPASAEGRPDDDGLVPIRSAARPDDPPPDWIHPFRTRSERRRLDAPPASAVDSVEDRLKGAIAHALSTIETWIGRREGAEALCRTGPLPTLAPTEEEEAWRRRARQLDEEAARLRAAALAWPVPGDASEVRKGSSQAPVGTGKGGTGPAGPGLMAELERSWARVASQARKGPAGDGRKRGGAEIGF